MTIYAVFVGYYERLDSMFSNEQKALAYIAHKAEERWGESGLRPLVEDKEAFLQREMNNYTIKAWEVT